MLTGSLFAFLYTTISVLVGDPVFRCGFVPDDTFYYLTLARHFAASGVWTFDGGISVTTGFHLLHAYWLAAIYWLAAPGPETSVTIAMLGGILLTTIIAGVGVVFAWRTRALYPAAILSLILISRNVCLNAVSGLEWAWVVLIAGLYCHALVRTSLGAGRNVWLVPAGLGFLGSLARSDFGLLPFAVAFTVLVAHLLFGMRRMTVRAMSGLCGSVLGLALLLLHNFIVSGHWISSSAAMKRTWVDIYGVSSAHIREICLSLFARTNGSTPTLVGLLCFLVLVTGIWAWLGHRRPLGRWRLRSTTADVPALLVLWVACVIAIGGYVVIYTWLTGGIQVWYSANIVVPVFLFLVLPAASHRLPAWLRAASLAIVLILAGRQIPVAAEFLRTPEWPNQALHFEAGHYLRNTGLAQRVGSWNSGIIGYYQGGTVVNLDGLVNNAILPHIKARTVDDYLAHTNIGYVIDGTATFTSPTKLARSGIQGAAFLDSMTVVKSFADPQHPEWGSIVLYRLGGP